MTGKEANEYSEVDDAHAVFDCGMTTVETTEKALHSLNEDSALGPDMVPTTMLKHCSQVLAPILHGLIVAIYFDFRRTASAVDDTLGNAIVQTQICL